MNRGEITMHKCVIIQERFVERCRLPISMTEKIDAAAKIIILVSHRIHYCQRCIPCCRKARVDLAKRDLGLRETLVLVPCGVLEQAPVEGGVWPGASTPYKRWSKCTMEKVGEAFLQKLRGKCINLMH